MSRSAAIAAVTRMFASGEFLATLERSVAHRTESQEPTRLPELRAYLEDFIVPLIEPLGFASTLYPNPEPEHGPLLVAERIEACLLYTSDAADE